MFASMLATAAGTRAELAAESSGARARVASAATSLSEELTRGVTDTVRECFERQRKLEMASKAVRREAEEMNKQVCGGQELEYYYYYSRERMNQGERT